MIKIAATVEFIVMMKPMGSSFYNHDDAAALCQRIHARIKTLKGGEASEFLPADPELPSPWRMVLVRRFSHLFTEELNRDQLMHRYWPDGFAFGDGMDFIQSTFPTVSLMPQVVLRVEHDGDFQRNLRHHKKAIASTLVSFQKAGYTVLTPSRMPMVIKRQETLLISKR